MISVTRGLFVIQGENFFHAFEIEFLRISEPDHSQRIISIILFSLSLSLSLSP